MSVAIAKSLTFTIDTTAFTWRWIQACPLCRPDRPVNLTVQTNAHSGYTLNVNDLATGLQSAATGNPTVAKVSTGKATSVVWPGAPNFGYTVTGTGATIDPQFFPGSKYAGYVSGAGEQIASRATATGGTADTIAVVGSRRHRLLRARGRLHRHADLHRHPELHLSRMRLVMPRVSGAGGHASRVVGALAAAFLIVASGSMAAVAAPKPGGGPRPLAVSVPPDPTVITPGGSATILMRVVNPGTAPVSVTVSGRALIFGDNGRVTMGPRPDPQWQGLVDFPAGVLTIPPQGFLDTPLTVRLPLRISPLTLASSAFVTPAMTAVWERQTRNLHQPVPHCRRAWPPRRGLDCDKLTHRASSSVPRPEEPSRSATSGTPPLNTGARTTPARHPAAARPTSTGSTSRSYRWAIRG